MIDHNPYPRPTAKNICSMESLLYFVWERECIRITKESGSDSPYTDDPIFAKYKFTNIHRRDDRVSKWIIENLIEPAVDDGDEHLWFTLLIARLINWPPTLKKLLEENVIPCSPEDFSVDDFVRVIEKFKSEGNKVYSGAYMLYPTKMDPGGSKSKAVATYIIGDAIRLASEINDSIFSHDQFSVERIVTSLSKCFGISTFMAGQVAADLTYTGSDFEDVYSYAPIGPGSSRGLNYLLERKPFANWNQFDFNTELQLIDQRIVSDLDITDLTLHDVQNIMCEYSKYYRTLVGTGVPKTLYKPEGEF